MNWLKGVPPLWPEPDGGYVVTISNDGPRATIPCEECDGKGTVKVMGEGGKWDDATCSDCDGTGEIEVEDDES